jgi:hypothetical protein
MGPSLFKRVQARESGEETRRDAPTIEGEDARLTTRVLRRTFARAAGGKSALEFVARFIRQVDIDTARFPSYFSERMIDQ